MKLKHILMALVVISLPACDEFKCDSEFDSFDGVYELNKGTYEEVRGETMYCFDAKFFGHAWLKMRHAHVDARPVAIEEDQATRANEKLTAIKIKLRDIYDNLNQ